MVWQLSDLLIKWWRHLDRAFTKRCYKVGTIISSILQMEKLRLRLSYPSKVTCEMNPGMPDSRALTVLTPPCQIHTQGRMFPLVYITVEDPPLNKTQNECVWWHITSWVWSDMYTNLRSSWTSVGVKTLEKEPNILQGIMWLIFQSQPPTPQHNISNCGPSHSQYSPIINVMSTPACFQLTFTCTH